MHDYILYSLLRLIGIKRCYTTWYITIFKTVGTRPNVCKIVVISKIVSTFVRKKIVQFMAWFSYSFKV
jgi:hypothetical protein